MTQRVFDRRQKAHPAAATRTGQHVEVKGPAHQVGPGPVAGLDGRLVCGSMPNVQGGVTQVISKVGRIVGSESLLFGLARSTQ